MLNLGYLINTAQQFLQQINIHIKLKKLVILNSHFAYRQSIIPFSKSNLFWIEKLMKLVSTKTRYGNPNEVL